MSLSQVNQFLSDLIAKYANDREKVNGFTRVLIFIHQESTRAAETGGITPVRDFIVQLLQLENKVAIDNYLEKLVEDTKRAENDPQYVKIMSDLYKMFSEKTSLPKKGVPSPLEMLPEYLKNSHSSVPTGIVSALSIMPEDTDIFALLDIN